MKERKISFLDYASVFMKWRKYIIINFFIVCFITAIITLIIPKTFTASTTILPPVNEEGGFGLSQVLSKLPIGGLGVASDESNILLAIFESRTVMETIVKRFDLMRIYEIDNMEETVKALRDKVSIEFKEDGSVTLSASAKTGFFSGEEGDNKAREFAKNLANAFVEEMDKMNTKIKTEKARNNKIVIEKRYLQNKADMNKAEEELKTFQEQYGVIALPEQTAAAIQAAAELKAQITIKEVEIGILSQNVSDSHGELISAKRELTELKIKLNEMITRSKTELLQDGNGENNQNLYIPFDEVPALGVQYLRFFREVTLQEKLMEFLLPEYEQAKLQEARDTPTVQIIDPAARPEKKSSPKRMFIVAFVGLASIFFFAAAAYISVNFEYIKQIDPDRHDQIITIISNLKPNRWFK